MEALEAGGIAYSGYTYRYVAELHGHKIGFGGCRETVWRQKPEVMREDLQALREAGCEVIVYSCHWGKEYAARHNERQEQMAQEAIKGGADLVIGTHPPRGAGRRRKERRGDPVQSGQSGFRRHPSNEDLRRAAGAGCSSF